MGYSTDFEGSFAITPTIDEQTRTFVNGFSNSRRMKRDLTKLARMLNISVDTARDLYGVDGELYFNPKSSYECGQEHDPIIVDYNSPPTSQPSLWCNWIVNKDGELVWNGAEKFYEYVAWVRYLIEKIFKPRGYTLSGTVNWYGEDRDDRGIIRIKDNIVKVSLIKSVEEEI